MASFVQKSQKKNCKISDKEKNDKSNFEEFKFKSGNQNTN